MSNDVEYDWDSVIVPPNNRGEWGIEEFSFDPESPETKALYAKAWTVPEQSPEVEVVKAHNGFKFRRSLVHKIHDAIRGRKHTMRYGRRPSFNKLTPEQNVYVFGPRTNEWGGLVDEVTNEELHEATEPNENDLPPTISLGVSRIDLRKVQANDPGLRRRVYDGLARAKRFIGESLRTKTGVALGMGALALSAAFFANSSFDSSETPRTHVSADAHTSQNDTSTTASQNQLTVLLPGSLDGNHPVITVEGSDQRADESTQVQASAVSPDEAPKVLLEPGETVWGKVREALHVHGIDDEGATAKVVAQMRAQNPDIDLDNLEVGEQTFSLPVDIPALIQ